MLPATRDDCRRVLRRLELEAYSYTVSALRAQGPLRTEAQQTLAALRQTLHIGAARHQAEARRVCNDELLATIAEQLAGSNTELEWVQEGRRKIPIMPRGVPQTIYTAIADRAAIEATEENEIIARKIKGKRSAQIVSTEVDDASDEEMKDTDAIDDVNGNMKLKIKADYPPIVTSDQSLKIKTDEGPPRKKSRPELLVISHRVSQKHPNLSQIYTSYSKSHTGKLSASYGRNPYSQSGKAAAKSNYSGLSKTSVSKHRSLQKHSSSGKHCGQVAIPHHRVRSGIKSPTDPHIAGSQALVQNQIDTNAVKSQTPVYQANYVPTAQSGVEEYDTDAKMPVGSTILSDSPTMQLLTQTSISRDDPSMQMSSEDTQSINPSVHYSIANSNMSITVPAGTKAGKPCHLIIKKKSDGNPTDGSIAQKFQVTNKQLSKTDLSNLKVLQNRQVRIQPSNNSTPQKMLNSSAKLIATKIVTQMNSNNNAQQVLLMPKSPNSPTMQRNIGNASLKNYFISASGMTNITSDPDSATLKHTDSESLSKSMLFNNSDMKLSTKTFLLNSKSGQKMVVLPAKRPKALAGQTVPLLQVKGVKPAAVKLVTVSSPTINNQPKPNITVLSKSISSNVMGSPAKIVSKDSLNQSKVNTINATSNLQITPKKNPSSKGNIIVVQKGNTLHKNQLPLSKTECNILTDKTSSVPLDAVVPNSILTNIPQLEPSVDKPSENVVFLEVSSDQLQQEDSFTTFMDKPVSAEIKESTELIAGDAQILFHTHADSMESTADSLIEESQIQESVKSESSFSEMQQMEDEEAKGLTSRTAALSRFTDWEEELANSNVKENDDSKTSEMNLVLEMSSDSESYIHAEEVCKDKDLSQDESQYDEQENTNETFVQHSSISQASKTLLSQLQDDGSSSNDSPFVLTKNLGFRSKRKSDDDANITFLSNKTIDELETSQEQKQECRSKPSRADNAFSSAVAAGDISLGTFEYLEDNANSREELFQFNTGEGKTTADVGT